MKWFFLLFKIKWFTKKNVIKEIDFRLILTVT
jgi:hypothetical protein